MADLIHVVARLQALQNGRAVPIVSQRQVVIQPHARILTLLSMAGEDTSVHAAAYGGFGEPAQIHVIADPRSRDDQYALLRWLLPFFETCYAQCRADGTFPQIWVSSAGAFDHLETLADRLRFTDEPDIQRLGELSTYASERSPIAGQQALISASGALRLHCATGQQEAEDEHLAALLTWIEPPAGRDVFAAVAGAEGQPMSVRTDTRFDRDQLQPTVSDFHGAATPEAARATTAESSGCSKASSGQSTRPHSGPWPCSARRAGSRALCLMNSPTRRRVRSRGSCRRATKVIACPIGIPPRRRAWRKTRQKKRRQSPGAGRGP